MSIPVFDFDRYEAEQELATLKGYDSSYTLSYYNAWSDFESSGWLAIFEKNGEFFRCIGGYSPEVGDMDEPLEYEPISIEEALEEIEEMEAACSEVDVRMSR